MTELLTMLESSEKGLGDETVKSFYSYCWFLLTR